MHTYTHNPYEIPTPTTPRDEASSSNQQLVNTQKTPDHPENMRRVTTRTRVNLNEKLLSAAQEAAFAASQEVLRKQDIKRKSDLLLVQIEEEEKRALIKFAAMQQAVQIEKQAQELAVAAREANALTLKMQDNMKKNPKNINKVLRELRDAYTKSADINLATIPPRSVFLSAEYLQKPTSFDYKKEKSNDTFEWYTKRISSNHDRSRALKLLGTDYRKKASSNLSPNNI